MVRLVVYVQGLRFYVLCSQEREGCLGMKRTAAGDDDPCAAGVTATVCVAEQNTHVHTNMHSRAHTHTG